MRNNLFRLLTACVVACMFFLFSACEKDEEVGMNIQPEEDMLNLSVIDTFQLNSSMSQSEYIVTSNSVLNVVGQINDPLFGKTDASFYTQFHLPTTNVTFHDPQGNSPVLDSLVLYLTCNSIYGDTNAVLNFHVYELKETLPSDSIYSNQEFKTDAMDIANVSVNLKNRVGSTIAIKLDKILGEKIIAASKTDNLSNDLNFKTFFKGLHISATLSSSGAMMYMDLLTDKSSSKLRLYYNDSLHYDFNVDKNCVRSNNYKHDYSNASEIKAQLQDNALGMNLLYIQPQAGLKGKIVMPHLVNLKNKGKLAINKAELVVSVDKTKNSSLFEIPEILSLKALDNNGEATIMVDQLFKSIGGGLIASKDKYVFNITRYIQDILDGKINNNGLILSVASSDIIANRVVVFGGDKKNSAPLKLKVYYTLIQ